ncbi:unnamed protein product [Vicia faba]|uniref:Uncharacterized protein n=1 Tax=Vicia faba TaxID=3906 RepID=A0AAV1ALM3_VICFA|nr:unnamed protein product [Vicia faba]
MEGSRVFFFLSFKLKELVGRGNGAQLKVRKIVDLLASKKNLVVAFYGTFYFELIHYAESLSQMELLKARSGVDIQEFNQAPTFLNCIDSCEDNLWLLLFPQNCKIFKHYI